MNNAEFASPHVLVLERTLAAPRAAVWRCWTEPGLIERWFCPVPWRATEVRADLRPGGASFTRMQGPGPDGQPMVQDCPGCYLLVEPMQRLVFTDAFVGDWLPGTNKPFMVGDIRFADAPGGGTRYTAIARHWSAEDRDAHEKMGFHEGWGKAADQLEALARTL
ncbi:MAG: SRPBCC family protein [Burkholderiales bacterium]|nr:SRPBCC family protein [Burkholderiales bacterium]